MDLYIIPAISDLLSATNYPSTIFSVTISSSISCKTHQDFPTFHSGKAHYHLKYQYPERALAVFNFDTRPGTKSVLRDYPRGGEFDSKRQQGQVQEILPQECPFVVRDVFPGFPWFSIKTATILMRTRMWNCTILNMEKRSGNLKFGHTRYISRI